MTRQNRAIPFRQLSPHSKDCSALQQVAKGLWNTPWYVLGPEPERRDRAGRRSRFGMFQGWFRIGCNSFQCEAEAVAKLDEGLTLCPPGRQRKR